MRKHLLHLLVLTHAMLLAFPPSWCCMVRASAATAEDSKPRCCCHKDASPCDDQEQQPDPRPADDCFCHVDSTLPPQSELLARDLAAQAPFALLTDLATAWVAGVGQESSVEIAPSPPLQIRHCVWTC